MKKVSSLLIVAIFMFTGSALASDYVAFEKDMMEPYGFYKKSIALTSKKENKDKAINVVNKFIGSWTELAKKYEADVPVPFSHLENFAAKITRPVAVGKEALELLNAGEVKKAHEVLEEVRYLLWKMRVDVGITSLNDRINDFHEAMEVVLDSIKADDSAGHLIHVGNRYGAWLAIKWEEVAKIAFSGTDVAAFQSAVSGGKKAIVDIRESLGKADAAASKKAGDQVKKFYKEIFFLPECS